MFKWLKKKSSALIAEIVSREQQARYNALFTADPQRVINAITAYECGSLAPLARIIEECELRDDKMKTCANKLRASVARCDYAILKREGYANDERAERHAQILRRFWSGVRATSRFRMDEMGGFNLLKKQMMKAESYGYEVHEIIWRVNERNELSANFIEIPLWHFENRTGKLRFLPTTNQIDGIEMKRGEWMVSTGEAIGVAASICACLKRCTLADWAVFCERCGMPFFIGKTGAPFKSQQWENLKKALEAIGREARIQVDKGTDIEAVQIGGANNQPYSNLVEWSDRAISCLYRGADLSTLSQQMGAGVSLQGDEVSLIEEDACARLGETLHEQVERFVIQFETGDDEPLAAIKIASKKKPNIATEIAIDQHLVSMGCKLSQSNAMQRYGRIAYNAEDKNDKPLEMGKSTVFSPERSSENAYEKRQRDAMRLKR